MSIHKRITDKEHNRHRSEPERRGRRKPPPIAIRSLREGGPVPRCDSDQGNQTGDEIGECRGRSQILLNDAERGEKDEPGESGASRECVRRDVRETVTPTQVTTEITGELFWHAD